MRKTDELNHGYLSHSILYYFYRIIDFIGYRLIKRQPLKLMSNKLLFVNLGRIGDLILFRYVIEDFLKLGYVVDLLIQDEYKFLFTDLKNVNLITIMQYKERKVLSGFFKILFALKHTQKKYAVACHFRGYLGTGILATYISGVAQNAMGYGTAGFGFLLNHEVNWQPNVHESIHLLNILQVLESQYQSINLNVYDKLLIENHGVLAHYELTANKYIVIHATSQNYKKNIPQPILKSTIQYLLENAEAAIVFVGLEVERSYVKDCMSELNNPRLIFTHGEVGVLDVRSLVANSMLFIGIDSAIAHLSSGLELPKIIWWHSLNSVTQWQPLGKDFIILKEPANTKNDSENMIIEQIIHMEKHENTLV